MAELHALVDAMSGVIISGAVAPLVLRLAQLFSADIPATGNFMIGRFEWEFVMSLFYCDLYIRTSGECRADSTPAP